MWNAQSHQIWQKSRPVAFNLASETLGQGVMNLASQPSLLLKKNCSFVRHLRFQFFCPFPFHDVQSQCHKSHTAFRRGRAAEV
jgi:hypothetical protein